MNKITTSLAALGLAATFSLAAVAPASADQAAATRNEIIGGLALVAGIAAIANSNNNRDAYQYDDRGYQQRYEPAYQPRERNWNNDAYRNRGEDRTNDRRDGDGRR